MKRSFGSHIEQLKSEIIDLIVIPQFPFQCLGKLCNSYFIIGEILIVGYDNMVALNIRMIIG
jgi:hypothetical protein